MLKVIKKQLINNINTANKNNELTTQKMYNIAYESVIQYTLGEEKALANNFRIALNGAQEASDSFTGSIRDGIEAALADTKLKNTELLGLTKDTVKQAIFCAIETSTQLENDIIIITCRATTKALAESRFNAEGISKVTENVLLAAVKAAEELDKHVLLTASAATEGFAKG